MGTYKQGIYGPYSGRVGNVIGSFWKGRCIMRIRAASYNDANTVPQQKQRMKWKIVSAFIKANRPLIYLGFGATDHTLTPYNVALKENLEAFKGEFPEVELDMTKVALSRGTLSGLENPVMEAASGSVEITWDPEVNNANSFEDDKLHVSAISEDGDVVLFKGIASRSEGHASLLIPNSSGKSYDILAFLTKSGIEKVSTLEQVSDSQRLGVAIL